MIAEFQGLKFTDLEQNPIQSTSSTNTQFQNTPPIKITQDFPMMSTHLLDWIESKLYEGKYQLCLDQIESVQKTTLEKQPRLMILKTTAMIYCDFPGETIIQHLDEIEKTIVPDELKGEILALRAKTEVNLGKIKNGIRLSHKAYSKIEKGNLFFRKLIERNLGLAYTIKGDLRNAVIWFENLLLSGFKVSDFNDILASYHYLAHIHKIQGQLGVAGVIYRKALAFITENKLEIYPFSIKTLSGYGHLLIQRNELDQAIIVLKQSIRLAKMTSTIYAHAAYHSLCEAYVRKGNITNAFKVLYEFQNQLSAAEDRYIKLHSEYASAIEARINLEAGRINQAYKWLLSRGFYPPSTEILQKNSLFELGYSLPIAARIYISRGMYSQAINLLSPIVPKFVHQGANSYLIRTLNALAIAYYKSGASLKAMIIINKTIRLAEPENNLGDFIFIGKQLIPILSENQKNNPSRDFSMRIISILSSIIEDYQHQAALDEVMPRLSRREMEVLQLLSKGLTNQEIAENLYLSTNTIKSHTIKIYRKLNVNNRKRAVRKARIIGILPEQTIPLRNPST